MSQKTESVDKIQLTGNPFVDTGLAVIAYLSGCSSIDDLTLSDMKSVHGDGLSLARNSIELKSTYQLFSSNCLILQNRIDREQRIINHTRVTLAILNSIGHEDVVEKCDTCGHERSLDLDKLVKASGYDTELKRKRKGKAQVQQMKKESTTTYHSGRDWFPLAGSMGSDAQALPCASRSLNFCAKCLFAVQYLPLGVFLVKGRLCIYQCTSKTFWYDLIGDTVESIQDRISAANFDTIGRRQGSWAAIERIINVMHNMHNELEPETSVYMWLFSNAGTGPDCSIEEIPNNALRFLFQAIKHIDRREIMDLVTNNIGNNFLDAIERGEDYNPLYPRKGFNGVSNKLFSLYQIIIRGITVKSLTTAYKIAKHISTNSTEKEFQTIGKDVDTNTDKQTVVRGHVIEMIRQGGLTFDEYTELFLSSGNSIMEFNRYAWKFIKYYMHNLTEAPYDKIGGTIKEVTNLNQITYISGVIFNSIVKARGKEWFNKNVISGREIKAEWLRRQFAKLALTYEGFTYNGWKNLCVDEQGKEKLFALFFTFRAMWTEWFRNDSYPIDIISPTELVSGRVLDTDLKLEHEQLIKLVMNNYIAERGKERFQKYVLDEVMTDSISRSLYWFKEQSARYDDNFIDESYWQNEFADNSIKKLRQFQLHLSLVNAFRSYCTAS
jgi:CRISPR-associated protein Cst1